MIANQRTTSYDERFKFTGKERDGESGYDYFGARYYTPPLGIWISVDPLTDKYPHATPYLYCGGNPVMFFDPDGRYQCNMITLTVQDPKHPELATKEDAQLWLDTKDPLGNRSILYIAFHFKENASPEEINTMADRISEVIEQWNKEYEKLKGADGGQRQIVLQACYGAQVAEKVAEQNPGINVSGAVGRLDTGVYYDKNSKRKSRNVRNSTQRLLFGIIPFGRKDAPWITYRSDKKGSSPIVVKEEKAAEHKVDRIPTQKQDDK